MDLPLLYLIIVLLINTDSRLSLSIILVYEVRHEIRMSIPALGLTGKTKPISIKNQKTPMKKL